MKKIYFTIIASILFISSCDEKKMEPITSSLGKPGIPSEVKVEPIAGGAVISYSIPNNEDILGVKAVYQLADGKTREAMSSLFNDQIKIEGYIDKEEKSATLYAINRAMVLSDPVEINFTPLESAISKVSKSVRIIPDFGGAQYTWTNEDRASLTLEALTTDSTGIMTAMKILTTASANGIYNLRGYDTDPRWFGAILRDNFGNVTDTIFPTNTDGEKIRLSPMYEQKLDKKLFRFLYLNNDQSFNHFGANENDMIDDNPDSFGHSSNGSLPATTSIDLGVKAKLSRVVILQRNNEFYGWGNPRTFDIYGTNKEPDKSGNWDEWSHLRNCEIIKPSGLPLGDRSEEDIETAKNGHDFTFDLEQEPLRYVRLKFTSIWTSSTFCHPAEITFYGDPNVTE